MKDIYWGDKQDYWKDPMLVNSYRYPSIRSDASGVIKFSNLSAAIISGDHRRYSYSEQYPGENWFVSLTPEYKNIELRVLDINGNPLSNANVKMWDVSPYYPDYESKIVVESTTNSEGKLFFDWGEENVPYEALVPFRDLRLIKVYKEGYIPSAKYLSVLDAQEAKILRGENHWIIKIQMNPK